MDIERYDIMLCIEMTSACIKDLNSYCLLGGLSFNKSSPPDRVEMTENVSYISTSKLPEQSHIQKPLSNVEHKVTGDQDNKGVDSIPGENIIVKIA